MANPIDSKPIDLTTCSSDNFSPLPQSLPLKTVTGRAMAIACALMPLLALWVVNSEIIWYTGHSTAISLFYHVTFTLFLLAIGNLWVQKKYPGAELSPGELMTIYVMLSVAGTLCSHDLLQILIPLIAYPVFAANPQNRWSETLLPYLKPFAIVSDPEAITELALGNGSIYNWHILSAWLKPLLFWGSFLMALMFSLLFLNVLIRKQWTEKERLSFPIIQIPMMISANLTSLLASRLFWYAFGFAALLDVLNGLNFFFPGFPHIPVAKAFLFKDYLLERPWNAIANTEVHLYPFVIGLVYFLPTDLAFSCWFFFALFKLEMVAASHLGIQDLPGFPFVVEQSGGAYMGLGLLALWVSRRHFLAVWRTIWGMPGGLDESEEAVRYRTAVIGFILCAAWLLACGCVLGGSLPMMLAFFFIFFLYSIAIARMRAELGPPAHDLHHMGPDMILTNLLGTQGMSKGNLATFSLFFWFNRAYRAHFSAHSLEGFKAAQIYRIHARSMLFAIALALVVGTLSAFWGILHNFHVYGYSGRPAGDAFSAESWNRMAAWISLPQLPKVAASVACGIGLVFALVLGALRMKFTWWLWHPVGYATCSTWSMEKLWMCLFIGWLVKLLITRYGGAQTYRKMLPFFVGLVLGEFVVGSLWSIFGGITGIPVYHFWGG